MLTRQDIVDLLTTTPFEDVLRESDRTRKGCCGDEVHLRGIVEFSNVCVRTCSYCGLRGPNRRLQRYRMSPDEIVDAAKAVRAKGLRTIVLQSGEDPRTELTELCDVIRRIKAETDLAITLSIGLRTPEEYRCLREAGADRYLIKEETFDGSLYARLHAGLPLVPRVIALSNLKRIGYETGGGIIVGLPGQTAESVADSLIHARDLALDMYAIGPFVPHPDTPLADHPTASIEQTLRTIAVARIILGDVHIPATTALQAIHPRGWELGLLAGANVIMSLETPAIYREDYSIYPNPGRADADDRRAEKIFDAIRRAGRRVGVGPGSSMKLDHEIVADGGEYIEDDTACHRIEELLNATPNGVFRVSA